MARQRAGPFKIWHANEQVRSKYGTPTSRSIQNMARQRASLYSVMKIWHAKEQVRNGTWHANEQTNDGNSKKINCFTVFLSLYPLIF
jgi:hypothetical protein